MNIPFRFCNNKRILSAWVPNLTNIADNKNCFLTVLLGNNDGVFKMLEILEYWIINTVVHASFTKKENNNQATAETAAEDKKIQILTRIKEKLQQFLKDDSNMTEIQQLDDFEVSFLRDTLEFSIPDNPLISNPEQQDKSTPNPKEISINDLFPSTEHSIISSQQSPQIVVSVTMNLEKALQSMQHDKLFQFLEDPKNIPNLFCLACAKFVSKNDILNPQTSKISCSEHIECVISVEQLKIELLDQIKDKHSQFSNLKQKVYGAIQSFDKQNQVNLEILQNIDKEAENLFKIQKIEDIELSDLLKVLNEFSNSIIPGIDSKIYNFDEMKLELAATGATIDKFKQEIEVLNQVITEKDEVLLRTSQELAEEREDNDKFTQICLENEQMANKLQIALTESENQIEELQKTVKAADKAMALKKQKISELEIKNSENNAKITQQTQELTELQQELKMKRSEILNIQRKVLHNEQDISSMGNEISAKTKRIVQLETETSAKSQKIENLERDVAQKSKQIEEFNKELHEKDEKLTKTMEILVETQKIVLERERDIQNHKISIQNLENEVKIQKNEIQVQRNELDSKILELSQKNEKSDQKIETISSELANIDSVHMKKTEDLRKTVEDHTINLKTKEKLVEHLERRHNVFTNKLTSIKMLFQDKEIKNEEGIVNVVLICDSNFSSLVKEPLERNNKDQKLKPKSIFVISIKQFNDLNEANMLKTKNWDPIDVFVVWSSRGNALPDWLMDFLVQKHQQGKGIVIGMNCLALTDSENIDSTPESENSTNSSEIDSFFSMMPCFFGEKLPETKSLKLGNVGKGNSTPSKQKPHPILKNVMSFDGGIPSLRANLKLKDSPKNNAKVSVVAKWGDELGTPLIITKKYGPEGKTKKYGNIVVLNFMLESNFAGNDCGYQESSDAHLMLQNAVLWAAKLSNKEDTSGNTTKKLWNDLVDLLE